MARIESIDQLRRIIPDMGPRGAAKIRSVLCAQGQAFIQRAPFLMMATLGDYGIEVSQKGGKPGFVEIVDEDRLRVPEFVGNHLAIGLQNILRDPRVGLAFMRPATDEVLRVTGTALLDDDAEACARLGADGKPAKLVIDVRIERAAFHCVRSARRAGLWQPDSWDAPTRVSFGKIYADALARPEIEDMFDTLAEESDARLY